MGKCGVGGGAEKNMVWYRNRSGSIRGYALFVPGSGSFFIGLDAGFYGAAGSKMDGTQMEDPEGNWRRPADSGDYCDCRIAFMESGRAVGGTGSGAAGRDLRLGGEGREFSGFLLRGSGECDRDFGRKKQKFPDLSGGAAGRTASEPAGTCLPWLFTDTGEGDYSSLRWCSGGNPFRDPGAERYGSVSEVDQEK